MVVNSFFFFFSKQILPYFQKNENRFLVLVVDFIFIQLLFSFATDQLPLVVIVIIVAA